MEVGVRAPVTDEFRGKLFYEDATKGWEVAGRSTRIPWDELPFHSKALWIGFMLRKEKKQ
jgi:hypothetical protein